MFAPQLDASPGDGAMMGVNADERRHDMSTTARSGTTRLARDMGLAGFIGLSAALATMVPWPSKEAAVVDGQAGKRLDRLAFEAPEDVPVRQTRIYDSLAMFARPSAEPTPWSEAVPPVLPAAAEPGRSEKASRPAIAAVPAESSRRDLVLPPARPASVATIRRFEPAPAAEPERSPVRIAGWAIPGTQYLPDREDASAVLGFVDDGARLLGVGAVRLARDGVDTIDRSVSRVGRSVAGAIRLP